MAGPEIDTRKGIFNEAMGIPSTDEWRNSWNPNALLTDETRRGSANHATLAAANGLMKAARERDRRTLEELEEWWINYCEVSKNYLGLQESPHSRIYWSWVAQPVQIAWTILKRQELKDWLLSSYFHLALCAANQSLSVRPWIWSPYRDSTPKWDGFGVAACGARSWNFNWVEDPSVGGKRRMFHHLAEWDGDILLQAALTGEISTRADVWTWTVWDWCKKNFLLSDQQAALRSLVDGVRPLEQLRYLIPQIRYSSGPTIFYARWKNGVASAMPSTKQLAMHTAPLYAAVIKKADTVWTPPSPELQVIAIDPGNRSDLVRGKGDFVFADDIFDGRAERIQKPTTSEFRNLKVTGLGDLIYVVKSSKDGIEIIEPKDDNGTVTPPPPVDPDPDDGCIDIRERCGRIADRLEDDLMSVDDGQNSALLVRQVRREIPRLRKIQNG